MQKFEFLSNVWWLCLPSFFSVLNAFKYPLLIGIGLATVIGLLSCLIGYCSSRWCCKKEVQETRRERRRLMSMEMDWVWEPGTPAFRERLTGLLDCAETLIHGPRWDSAFPLWFQSGPQASPSPNSPNASTPSSKPSVLPSPSAATPASVENSLNSVLGDSSASEPVLQAASQPIEPTTQQGKAFCYCY